MAESVFLEVDSIQWVAGENIFSKFVNRIFDEILQST